MPYPTGLDALKQLLGASSDLNADDPNGMIAQDSRANDNLDELKQHLGLQAEFPHTYFASAKAPTALAKQSDALAKGPNFGVAAFAQKDAVEKANNDALQAGYGGDTNIATPLDSSNPDASYMNVNRNAGTPAQQAGQGALAAARYKEDAPVRAAREKATAETQGRILQNKMTHDLLMNGQGGGNAPSTNPSSITPPSPTAGPGQSGAPGATQNPAQTQQPGIFAKMKDFVMGTGPLNGPGSYNSLSDLLSARAEKAMTGVSKTPASSGVQDQLLGNAQSLAGIFPSSRAAGVLSKIAQEFQSSYGNETPAASVNKLKNQISSLNNAEREFDDPQYRMKMGANGMLEPASQNQTIERAKIAVSTSRESLQRALAQIEALHPGITQTPSAPAPGAPLTPPSSRFERIQ